MPVEIRVKSNAPRILRGVVSSFMDRKAAQRFNRKVARKAASKVKGAMLSAGIRFGKGKLFSDVKVINITSEGFDIQVPKVAFILEHGVKEHIIMPVRAQGLAISGHSVEGVWDFVRHRIEPKPWQDKATKSVAKLIGDEYIVGINRRWRRK